MPEQRLGPFLECLRDDDVAVRAAAADSLYSIIHADIELVRHLLVAAPGEGKSAEVRGIMPRAVTQATCALTCITCHCVAWPPQGEVAATGLLPILYENATPVKAHKRKVDLGRSKVIIDDGLELRKATHRCMAAIIEHASERVDATEFLPVLRIGLLDSPEVQVRWRRCPGPATIARGLTVRVQRAVHSGYATRC